MRKLGMAAGVALLLATTLTGCESFAEGPASISRSGNDLLFAVCVDMEVTKMLGDSRSTSGDLRFIELEGSGHIATGTTMSVKSLPGGLIGSAESIDLSNTQSILISVQGPDHWVSAAFGGVWGTLEVPDNGWLQTDDTVTAEPCP